MLFWLFIIALVVGIICIIFEDKSEYYIDWRKITGWVITITAASSILISIFCIVDSYSTAEALIAANNERYKVLVYQLENNLYDNDNDLGKKELYNEIKDWNEDLSYYQSIQDNFWIGIYFPNMFDQFKFIEFKSESV